MGHNGNPDDPNRIFQERYANAMKAFREYREGASFASRVNRDILCAMCEAEGLSTSGYKVELLARLKKWVCHPGFNPYVRSVTLLSSVRRISSPLHPEKKVHHVVQC